MHSSNKLPVADEFVFASTFPFFIRESNELASRLLDVIGLLTNKKDMQPVDVEECINDHVNEILDRIVCFFTWDSSAFFGALCVDRTFRWTT